MASKDWRETDITPRERSVRFIKAMTNDELQMFFIGNLPLSEEEKQELDSYTEEDWFETWANNIELRIGREYFLLDWDYDIFTKCCKELYKETPRQRIARYLTISTDNNWQVKHKAWKKAVHEKDNYKCQHCGSNKRLHAHHIKPRSEFPEIQFETENGITLCHDCHKAVHHDRTR